MALRVSITAVNKIIQWVGFIGRDIEQVNKSTVCREELQ